MKITSKKITEVGDVTYQMPDIKAYEIRIEDSILIVSGKTPPAIGYEGEDWI